MFSRRQLLLLTGVALAAPQLFGNEKIARDKVPAMLDHILLGCSDLDAGIAYVENLSGVRPAYGGSHPGRGTRNALLSLGQLHYLEIIAPDPAQTNLEPSAAQEVEFLKKLSAPQLVGWAARAKIDELIARLRQSKTAFMGPWAGSRKRPDGKTLNWRELAPNDDRGGLLPFFIEWGTDITHPSADAPSGCTLLSFEIESPKSSQLSQFCKKIGLEVQVKNSSAPRLRASISSQKDKFELTS